MESSRVVDVYWAGSLTSYTRDAGDLSSDPTCGSIGVRNVMENIGKGSRGDSVAFGCSGGKSKPARCLSFYGFHPKYHGPRLDYL